MAARLIRTGRRLSGRSVLALLGRHAINGAGPMPSSLNKGLSPYTRLLLWRANPDEETTEFGGQGGRESFPTPINGHYVELHLVAETCRWMVVRHRGSGGGWWMTGGVRPQDQSATCRCADGLRETPALGCCAVRSRPRASRAMLRPIAWERA